jgi:hypothetical protein
VLKLDKIKIALFSLKVNYRYDGSGVSHGDVHQVGCSMTAMTPASSKPPVAFRF